MGGADPIRCDIVRYDHALAWVRFGNTEVRLSMPHLNGSAGCFGSLFLSQPVGKKFEQGATVVLQLDPQHLSVVART